MRIIPDETKITYLIDSHPDTPEDADYMEVCERDTIEITNIMWRPDSWPDFVEYFNNSPGGMTALVLWEFGATSMLNALMSLKGDTK